MPTIEQLDKFWNGLQSTLNQADANIDLTRPEDMVRFRIANITNIGPNLRAFDADITCEFPFSENPHADLNAVTDEQLVSMQKAGKPDYEKLAQIFEAAREGRLFFKGLKESGLQMRQLVTDKDGNTRVLPDMSHATPEIMSISNNPCPPKEPKLQSAGIGNRIRAFFGSKEAKKVCDRVDKANARERQKYAKNLEEWNKVKAMDPDFREQVLNGNRANINYFQLPDEEAVLREVRLENLGTKAHKQPMVDTICDMTKAAAEKEAQTLSNLMKNSGKVTPEAVQCMAKIFYMKNLEENVGKRFENGTLTEKDIGLFARQAGTGSPEYRKNYDLVCNSEKFRNAFKQLTPDDFKAFAEDPKAASNKVYGKLALDFTQAPAASTKLHLEPAAVKETAKEAPVHGVNFG